MLSVTKNSFSRAFTLGYGGFYHIATPRSPSPYGTRDQISAATCPELIPLYDITTIPAYTRTSIERLRTCDINDALNFYYLLVGK